MSPTENQQPEEESELPELAYVPEQIRGDDFVETYSDYTEVGYSSHNLFVLFSEIKSDDAGNVWQLDRTRVNLHPQTALALYRSLAWALKNWKERNEESLMETLEDIGKLDQGELPE